MAGGQGAMAGLFIRNRRIFGNFNASSENFRTFAVGEGKGFELCGKSLNLAHSTLDLPRRFCSYII